MWVWGALSHSQGGERTRQESPGRREPAGRHTCAEITHTRLTRVSIDGYPQGKIAAYLPLSLAVRKCGGDQVPVCFLRAVELTVRSGTWPRGREGFVQWLLFHVHFVGSWDCFWEH